MSESMAESHRLDYERKGENEQAIRALARVASNRMNTDRVRADAESLRARLVRDNEHIVGAWN